MHGTNIRDKKDRQIRPNAVLVLFVYMHPHLPSKGVQSLLWLRKALKLGSGSLCFLLERRKENT
jgi:hypothetical protein